MEFKIKRQIYTDESTIGILTVDFDSSFAPMYTLEDKVRLTGVKVPGKTAIPAGRYQIIIDTSNRFKKLMPHILNVNGFSGIRVHSGNKAADTEGCIILGLDKAENMVLRSRVASALFYEKLEEGLKMGKCFITIENKEV